MEKNKKCKKGDSDCTFGKDGRTKEYTPSDLFHDVEITGLLELADMEDLRNDYKMLCKQGEKQYTDQEYQELPWEKFHGNFHEDGFLCVKNRDVLISNGIKFPDSKIAYKFSIETKLDNYDDKISFAFHKWFDNHQDYPDFRYF